MKPLVRLCVSTCGVLHDTFWVHSGSDPFGETDASSGFSRVQGLGFVSVFSQESAFRKKRQIQPIIQTCENELRCGLDTRIWKHHIW